MDNSTLRLETGDRTRLSGPGLRAFQAIGDKWDLDEEQRLTLLGDPSRSTYEDWLRKAVAREGVVLPLETMMRISAILGVYKGLKIFFSEESTGLAWLKNTHSGGIFEGRSPLDVMLGGAQDDLMTVRRYLDALTDGGLPTDLTPESGIAPVRAEDIE